MSEPPVWYYSSLPESSPFTSGLGDPESEWDELELPEFLQFLNEAETKGGTRKINTLEVQRARRAKLRPEVQHSHDASYRDPEYQIRSIKPLFGSRAPKNLIVEPELMSVPDTQSELVTPYLEASESSVHYIPVEVTTLTPEDNQHLAVTINAYLKEHPTHRKALFLLILIMSITCGSITALVANHTPTVEATSESIPSLPNYQFISSAATPAYLPLTTNTVVPASASAPYYDADLDALIYLDQDQAGYIIKPDDTLYWLALRFGYCGDFARVAAENNIPNVDQIEIGDGLYFTNTPTIEVLAGETMESIAEKCGVTSEELQTANSISPTSPLRPGMILAVPR